MPRPIKDNVGRVLIGVFLIKPIIDLFPGAALWWGPLRLAPTTIFGALVFALLVPYVFGRRRHAPPFGRIFEAFLIVNALSIVVGIISGSNLGLVGTINMILRILDSYVIYTVAFVAARRYAYDDVTPVVTAIVVGSTIVVVLNVVAVSFGITGFVRQAPTDVSVYGSLRQRGLYYDPGSLANVAFFSLVFTAFRFHLARANKALWLAFALIVIFADLYLIAASKSRAVIIELGIFGLVYMVLYQRAWGKLAAPVVVGGIILLGTVFFKTTYEEIFLRFETDVAALEDTSGSEAGVTTSGDVSLGKYAGLGSNRGALWAAALTEILQRPLGVLLIGDFSADARAHSDYIDVLGRNGIIGLILYVTIMVGLALKALGYARSTPRGHDRIVHFMAFTLALCYLLYAIPFRPLMYTTRA
jgi:O-antigen ligase